MSLHLLLPAAVLAAAIAAPASAAAQKTQEPELQFAGLAGGELKIQSMSSELDWSITVDSLKDVATTLRVAMSALTDAAGTQIQARCELPDRAASIAVPAVNGPSSWFHRLFLESSRCSHRSRECSGRLVGRFGCRKPERYPWIPTIPQWSIACAPSKTATRFLVSSTADTAAAA